MLQLLLAGGPGSGKSTSYHRLYGAQAPNQGNVLTDDTSLADREKAHGYIGAALGTGRAVEISFVYRPFQLAFAGMVERAIVDGRYLTIERMLDAHAGARSTILDVDRRFAGDLADKRLSIRVLDNSLSRRGDGARRRVPPLQHLPYFTGRPQ